MQIDWWTLGLQTINFLVVIWLLSHFLYRPIRRTIEEREAADQAASQDAQDKADAADQARQEYEKLRAELAQEQNEREAAFHKSMKAEKEKSLEAARKDADALLESAHEQIARDQKQALENLKSHVQGLATELARSALAAPLTAKAAITAVTAYLEQLPQADFDDLKQDIHTDGGVLAIVTSAKLAKPEQEAWRAALAQRLGEEIALVFKESPDILGGAELHFPHAALRFSVAARLDRTAKAMEV